MQILLPIMKPAFHLFIALMFVFQVSRAQTNFNRIACGGNLTINIKQGDSCSYSSNSEGKSDKNDMYKIIFEVYNNTLHIEGGNYKDAVANVTIKELKGLNIDGITNVICDNIIHTDELKAEFNGASKGLLKLEANIFILEADGASQIEIQGKCNSGIIELDGAAKVNAKKCIFIKCNVDANGASQCLLDSVTSDLKVEATGAAKIYLKNIPEVYVSTRSGLGKIYDGNETKDTTIKIYHEFNMPEITINEHGIDSSRGHKHYYTSHNDAGFNWSGVDIGFDGLLNTDNTLKAPAGYDYLEMNNISSVQINLNLLEKDIKIYRHYVMGMVGAGFSWNNYKFTTQYVLQPHEVTLTALPDTLKNLNINKLRVTYFNVPLMLGFNTSQNDKKAFHVAVGVVVGLRIGAMVKTSTNSKEGKNKDKTFALYNTDQVRYDVMLRLKYKWANIWASYSLNSLFRKNQGPEVHPVAVGVNLIEF